jgi:ATP-binding cassette subfamily F protein uup
MIDQARSGLKPTDSLFDAAGHGNSHVQVGDHQLHVATFLRRFLFRREQFDQPVSSLSGGERMRLLLARLLLNGSNVLLLDEPTNDLDLMTLRVLEEALIDFDGASLIISHDRALIDRVCTTVLSFEGQAKVGVYASREQANRAKRAQEQNETKKEAVPKKKAPKKQPSAKSKRSFSETRELEALPGQIETLESEHEELLRLLSSPDVHAKGPEEAARLSQKLMEQEALIEKAYARWSELEEKG